MSRYDPAGAVSTRQPVAFGCVRFPSDTAETEQFLQSGKKNRQNRIEGRTHHHTSIVVGKKCLKYAFGVLKTGGPNNVSLPRSPVFYSDLFFRGATLSIARATKSKDRF